MKTMRAQLGCVAFLVTAINPGIHAQDTLPNGEAVLERYVTATGGKAAYAKVHNSIATGRMEIVGQGLKGDLTVYTAEPSKMYSVFEIGGVGKIEEGTDGKVAWSLSAIQGARIKEGEEKALALRSANFNSHANWKQSYKSAETVGTEAIDGKLCYKVVLTPLEGKPETQYYEKESGLLLRQTGSVKTPMGEVPVDATVSDYRAESGILMPHILKQSIAGQQLSFTFASIRFNVAIPKDRFDLPPEIKTLLNRKEK